MRTPNMSNNLPSKLTNNFKKCRLAAITIVNEADDVKLFSYTTNQELLTDCLSIFRTDAPIENVRTTRQMRNRFFKKIKKHFCYEN